jgi:hypothetical protein
MPTGLGSSFPAAPRREPTKLVRVHCFKDIVAFEGQKHGRRWNRATLT